MLKGRWRCLDAQGGRLLYDPEKVCQIILACCVLHNICVSHGIELGENEMRMDQDDHPLIPAGWNTHITALRRLELIHQLYQQYKNKCTHVHFLQNVLFRHVCSKKPSIADRVRQQPHLQTHSSPFVNEKRKLVMADEAPMLVQEVLRPEMSLRVLAVPTGAAGGVVAPRS